MNAFLKRIERFLLSHTVWAFLTGVMFTSIVLALQLERYEWGFYLLAIGKVSLVFAPVLLFTTFRDWLQKRLPLLVLLVLWAFCFLAYPSLVEWLGWHHFLAPPGMDTVAVRMAGAWFLVTEVAIQLNNYWRESSWGRRWLKHLNLERGILIFLALFAIAYAALGFYVNETVAKPFTVFNMASYTFQIFLILLAYYGFYWINHYFLINRMLKEKGALYYTFGLVATVIVFYPVAAQLIYWLPMVRETQIHPVNNGNIFEDINAFIPLMGMLFSIPFILAIKWFRQNNELAQLAREQSETELRLLKQQVNPHFFFNTLNNLYALSLTKDQRTPEVILQLSELMRYVIYRGKEEHVSLSEEVQYLEGYIQLQRIRLHKKLDFRFERNIAEEVEVPPLLLLPLVENAFKHGLEPAENEGFLHIMLKCDDKALFFSCENSCEERGGQPKGIGLSNLQRRLELRFPGHHELQLEEEQHTFRAILNIRL